MFTRSFGAHDALRATAAFLAAGFLTLAAVGAIAQDLDMRPGERALFARSAKADALYRQLAADTKARCRPLSDHVVPSGMGPTNGRIGIAPPPQPSPRALCVQQGLRDARARARALLAERDAPSAQHRD